MRRRAVVSVLAAGLVLLVMLTPFAASTTPAAEVKPLDLAAMALRPDDLADQGYGIWGGESFTVDEAARLLAASGQGGGDASAIARRLRDAGWVNGQSITLGLPDASDPSRPSALIESQIVQFATSGGAAEGFAVVNDEEGVAGVSQHDPAATVGDRALITIDRSQAKDSASPRVIADLTFRHGSLVAIVAVVTLGTNAKPAADDVLIRLAGALMRRIELVEQGKGAPGLSTRALHLSGQAITTYYDSYERIGGVTIPYAGESGQTTAARDKSYDANKVTDSYTLLQTSGDYAAPGYGLYSLFVEHFARQKDAEAWMQGLTAESVHANGAQTKASRIGGAPSFGDDSVTYSYTYERPDKTRTAGYIVFLRTGRTTASVQLDGVPDVSLAVVGKVASAQAACQRGGNCLTPLTSPLSSPSGSATPVASPSSDEATPQASTPVAGGPVPMDANGAWSEPRTVQAVTQGGNPVQEEPVVAGRPDGSLVAVWLDYASGQLDEDGNEPLMWAEIPAGKTAWTKPARVHASAYASNGHNVRAIVFSPELVALPDGSLALAWQQKVADGSRLWLSTLPAKGATWTTPARLPGSNDHATYPSLAVGPGGELYAAWSQAAGAYIRPVFNERTASGTWGKARVVRTLPHHAVTMQDGSTQETGGYAPRLAAAPDGRVVVAWEDTEGTLTPKGTDGYRLIFTIRDPQAKDWSENLPVEPDDPTDLYGQPIAIAANGEGIVIVADDAGGALAWTMLPSGKTSWTKPATVADSSLNPRNPRLVVSPRGEMVVTWKLSKFSSSIHAAWLAPGERQWTQLPAVFKGATLYEYDVAALADGRVAVIVSVDGDTAALGNGLPAAVSVYAPGGPGSAKAQPTPNPRPDVKEPEGATVYRGNDAHTGIQPGPAPRKPALLWAWTPAGAGLSGVGTGLLTAPPTLVNGVLYVAASGGQEGRIAAIDAGTGKTRWVYKSDAPVVTAVTVGDGMAYAVTKENLLLALDAKTGKLVWKKGPASAFAPPAVVDGVVYISLAGTGQNGVVKALDAKSGKLVWQTDTDAYLQGGPTVVDGAVYLGGEANSGPNGTYPGVLYAFDATTGKARWHATLPELPQQTSDNAVNEPAVYGGMVYVSTKNGLLAAVDARTGKVNWTQRDCRSNVVVSHGAVYCGGKLFHAFDSLSGNELWELEYVGMSIGSDPVLVGETIVFAGSDLQLYMLDTRTRAPEAIPGVKVATGGSVSPLVVDGTIYVNNGIAQTGTGALLAIGDR